MTPLQEKIPGRESAPGSISHHGFSVVEVMSQCPTYFGRKNKLGDAVDMLTHFKENTTPIGSKAKEEKPDLIERGVFLNKNLPEYCDAYQAVIEKAVKGGS